MASGEKAILDTLYLRGRLPVEDEMDLLNVDFDALSNMATKYPRTVSRKVSRLADLHQSFRHLL